MNVIVDELVLLALPEVAEPPVVLPATFASPVDALCELLLETVRLLLFVTVTWLLVFMITLLVDSGPVLLIVALLLLLGAPPISPEPELSTARLALNAFAFAALPLFAEPPVVLWNTPASPDVAPCPLLLDALTLLLFVT